MSRNTRRGPSDEKVQGQRQGARLLMGMCKSEFARLEAVEQEVAALKADLAALRQRLGDHLDGEAAPDDMLGGSDPTRMHGAVRRRHT